MLNNVQTLKIFLDFILFLFSVELCEKPLGPYKAKMLSHMRYELGQFKILQGQTVSFLHWVFCLSWAHFQQYFPRRLWVYLLRDNKDTGLGI